VRLRLLAGWRPIKIGVAPPCVLEATENRSALAVHFPLELLRPDGR